MKTKISLLMASTIGLLLLLEGLLRIFSPLGFRLKGNKIVLPRNEKRIVQNMKGEKLDRYVVHTRNSLGFRGKNPPDNFSKYLTIITVGGSTTECIVLNDNETWTAYLGEKLSHNFSNLWINNAGLDGHSTFGHTILLKDYISTIKPKVTLFLIGVNDVGLKSSNRYDSKKYIPRRIDDLKEKLVFAAEHIEIASLLLNIYRYSSLKTKCRVFG